MRNVVILCTKLNEGGAERFAVNLANSLVKDENRVYLVTGPQGKDEYKLDPHVVRVPLISNNKNLITDAVKIRSFCIEKKINTLIAINLFPNFVACLANVNLKTKVVITERNAPGYLKLSLKTRFLKKILYWMADQYVFQTEGAKNCYNKKIRNNSVVIQNPVKTGIPFKEKRDNKEIVAVGRLENQKNYPCLIEAFSLIHKTHPDFILRIFGEGTLKDELTNLCKEKGLIDVVVFEGFCFDIHDRIKQAQIYVLSSDFEGMPNSLMEAMAMGFPVISTDCPTGGPRELINDGENGFLVSVGDSIGLANKISYLIDNPCERERVAQQAMNIRNTHSEESIVAIWKKEVLTDVIKQ